MRVLMVAIAVRRIPDRHRHCLSTIGQHYLMRDCNTIHRLPSDFQQRIVDFSK
jgi:hypothetical protein